MASLLGLTVSEWESIAKILGIAGAGCFFYYKARAGFNNQNLSLSVRAERTALSANRTQQQKDIVVVTIVVEKGVMGATTFQGLEARFRWAVDSKESSHLVVVNTSRQKVNPDEAAVARGESQLTWKTDADHPFLYLSPGEKTEFACYWSIPSGVPCEVDIVAIGRRKRNIGFQAQWRASVVSPPLAAVVTRPNAQ